MGSTRKSGNKPSWIQEYLPQEIVDSALFHFKITLPSGQVIEVDLTKDIDVDYENLENELSETPAQFIFWASVYSEMKMMVGIYERKLKARRGVLTEESVKLGHEKSIKLTVDAIKAIVEKDEDLNKLEAKLLMLQKHVGKLWFMVDALKMKSEHLRSLAGFKRQEREALRG